MTMSSYKLNQARIVIEAVLSDLSFFEQTNTFGIQLFPDK